MNTLTSTSLCNYQISKARFPFNISNQRNIPLPSKILFKVYANANTNELKAEPQQEAQGEPKEEATKSSAISGTAPLDQDLKKVGLVLNSIGYPFKMVLKIVKLGLVIYPGNAYITVTK